ncbi:uncharacterized protein LY89DRAFT_736590 [Mollisia scopiformis]|uniref:Uncharacterized protein n=1 Tax=Mollisia scopiformis TaxID=149040 RepID=A0A194X3F4_MOLSC|nr:uncharacterized protein LY89DRAFT_736590 [Mollisia scopiformis]KUJ14559.1 hypothetical protein LY89DRAFT_736590 [Mollisia scopiformis]
MSLLDLSILACIRLTLLAAAWSIAALGYLISLSVNSSTVLAFYFVVCCLAILLNVAGFGVLWAEPKGYKNTACMIAFEYVIMVLVATSIFVTALANIGGSPDGDENSPVQDRWNMVAFVVILVIG